MPVKKKVVSKWNFDCLGYNTNSENEVTEIFCKVCREYSELQDVKNSKKGVAKVCSETFVKGTSVVKKNNFSDHINRSHTHAAAVARISEKRKENEQGSSGASSSNSAKSNWYRNANFKC